MVISFSDSEHKSSCLAEMPSGKPSTSGRHIPETRETPDRLLVASAFDRLTRRSEVAAAGLIRCYGIAFTDVPGVDPRRLGDWSGLGTTFRPPSGACPFHAPKCQIRWFAGSA